MNHQTQKIAAKSIAFADVLVSIYVVVDDWYQANWRDQHRDERGAKGDMSASEILTLMIAHDYLPYPGESQFLAHIRANYLALFPKLFDRSQYNRRARDLRFCLECFRRWMLKDMNAELEGEVLLDTKPVPVVGYKRNKMRSDFNSSADYGVCVSRKLRYFGYKLVMLCSESGIPLVYDLVPANTDERQAAETVLCQVSGLTIIGDKGFIGEDWQRWQYEQTNNRVVTQKRDNQHVQNPAEFDRWLCSTRERIEGVFHEIQNTGRHIEHLRAKKVSGLVKRICEKVTSHLMRLWLKLRLSIDIQTFTVSVS
jgi:hypothetical protein